MQSSLFSDSSLPVGASDAIPGDQRGKRADLEQYFTPSWAANLLLKRYFADVGRSDFVVDAGAGRGAFLGEIPAEVPAIGVEIDPELAALARDRTGRDVVCGDFRFVDLPARPTAIVSNPPFSSAKARAFLQRGYELLPDSGRFGAILPAHFFSYSGPFRELADRWSIRQEIIPRELFHRLAYPLVFALFTKERVRTYHGFFLFEEAGVVADSSKAMKLVLMRGGRRQNVWREVVDEALRAFGGRVSPEQLRGYVQPRRPTTNQWWKDKLRQVLNEGPYQKDAEGYWSRAAA